MTCDERMPAVQISSQWLQISALGLIASRTQWRAFNRLSGKRWTSLAAGNPPEEGSCERRYHATLFFAGPGISREPDVEPLAHDLYSPGSACPARWWLGTRQLSLRPRLPAEGNLKWPS